MPQGAKIISRAASCRELHAHTPTSTLYLSHTSSRSARRNRERYSKTQWSLKTTQPKLCPSNIKPLPYAHTAQHMGEVRRAGTGRCPAAKTLSLQYVRAAMCERMSMPRGCPPCCLFVLTFLTIKPQGHKKIHRSAAERSRKWGKKEIDETITWIRRDNYTESAERTVETITVQEWDVLSEWSNPGTLI